MNRLFALIAILALVASACAAAVDTADTGPEGAANETATTQPSSKEPTQPSSTDTSAPSTTPGTDARGEGGDPQVTEPTASEQPPTTDQPPPAPSGTDPGNIDDGAATTQPSPPTGSGVFAGPLGNLVAVAVADLVGRLGVSPAQIEVVSAESVVWPDGALGCPQPDMSYIQVQMDGAKIVLSVDGKVYNYHSGGSRAPFLCVPTKSTHGQTPTTLIGGSFDD